MGLRDIVSVNLPSMGGTGRWYNPDFETYRTVAFDRDVMQRMIGFGTARADAETGEFLGFGDLGRNEVPIGDIVPRHCLNLGMWLLMVPEVYREELEGFEKDLWQQFGMQKIALDAVYRVVDWLRHWIGSHIEPTAEHDPRSVRFAEAWYELGVRVAYHQGKITMAEADDLIRRRV